VRLGATINGQLRTASDSSTPFAVTVKLIASPSVTEVTLSSALIVYIASAGESKSSTVTTAAAEPVVSPAVATTLKLKEGSVS